MEIMNDGIIVIFFLIGFGYGSMIMMLILCLLDTGTHSDLFKK